MMEKPASETKDFPIQIPWMYENNLEFYLRNTLTSIAIILLSYYNIRYTYGLSKLMSTHAAFRNGVRCKIITISTLIQVVLFLRLVWIWTCNFFWWKPNDGAEYFLVFDATFFSLSEVIPFLIFCVVLTCRIYSYTQDYRIIQKRKASKQSLEPEHMLLRTASETSAIKNKLDVSTSEID